MLHEIVVLSESLVSIQLKNPCRPVFLCGLMKVKLPVYDALILKNIESHHILLCFSASSSSVEIWRNGTKLLNTATVVLHHHDDQNVPVSITIQTKKHVMTSVSKREKAGRLR